MFDSIYHIFKDYDLPFDERGSQCGVIRKVQWVKNGAEPDESKAKLEIRKVYLSSEGEEKLAKGYTFSTDEGPHELAQNLIKIGYGHTKEVLTELAKRDDFKETIYHINDDAEEDNSAVFDMRDLLLSINTPPEEDDELEEAADE
jgi:hypothetical protein